MASSLRRVKRERRCYDPYGSYAVGWACCCALRCIVRLGRPAEAFRRRRKLRDGDHDSLRLGLLTVPARRGDALARPGRPLRQPVGSGGRVGTRGLPGSLLWHGVAGGGTVVRALHHPLPSSPSPRVGRSRTGTGRLYTRVPLGGRRLAAVRRGYAARAHLPEVGGCAPHGRGVVAFVPIPLAGIIFSVAIAWLGLV